MIGRWAMMKDSVVVNVCSWDGLKTTWTPPEKIEMVQAPDYVGIGWQYKEHKWLEPVYSERDQA